MIYPFRKVVFNCKEATLLSIKKEEGKIDVIERLKLWYHLLYCDPCRRFIAQWKKLAGKAGGSKSVTNTLSASVSEKIQREIDASL